MNRQLRQNGVDYRRLSFPRKLQFLFRPKRYKVVHGGRGGAKSWGIARALIIRSCKAKEFILCAREYQNSIAESVHKLLEEQITLMGLLHEFIITDTSIRNWRTGSEFVFAGLRNNVNKIKSMEGITICWVEEAEKVSKNSWSVLIPTVRRDGSEIWISFNPDLESDPTYQMCVVNPRDDMEVVEINWEDNPWFPDELRKEKDYLYRVDPEAAEHIWGGKCNTRSDAQIFSGKWRVEAFEPDEQNWNGPYFGQDFGFAADPAATSKSWIWDGNLYIEYAKFAYGVLNDDLKKVINTVPGANKHTIRADCSRPETIAHLSMPEHGGFAMVPCKKWDGCVEDGISYIRRTFKNIIIHPRNKQMKDEAVLYRYKVDKITGDVLPIIVDKHNHGWDAVRMSLEPAILISKDETHVEYNAAQDVQISRELDADDGPDFGIVRGISSW